MNLCVSKSVLVVINVDGSQEFLRSLLVVDKLSLWDYTGIQYLVSVEDQSKCIISSN